MERICVIKDIYKALYRFERDFADEHGITINEAMVLCALREGETRTAGALSEYVGLSNSRVSKVITAVENKGYVLDAACDAPLTAYFAARQAADARTAGNGRMARNLVEDAILNQSRRLTAGDVSALTQQNLETLLPEDFDLTPKE